MSATASSERDDLVRRHIIHEFDRRLVVDNLKGCYGRIAERFYQRIADDITGTRVLDAGCGFGQFSHICRSRHLSVHSIDIDEQSLAIAREVYGLPCVSESVYETSLPDNSIDTVVCNDAIAHFDIERLLGEARRIGATRVIVHESNLENPLLRSYRRAAGHEEYQPYMPDDVIARFAAAGYRLVELQFLSFVSLPISGGYQRRPLPIVGRFPNLVYAADAIIGRLLSPFSVARRLAFRFVATFDRADVLNESVC